MAMQQWLLRSCVACLLLNGAFGDLENGAFGWDGWNTTEVQELVASTKQGARRLKSQRIKQRDYHNYGRAVAELAEALSPDRLKKLANDYRQAYASADPFPHVMIDNMFPESTLRLLSKELPEETKIGSKCWVKAGQCYARTNARGGQADPNEFLKSALENEATMGIHTKVVFDFLKGSAFVRFLEDLSGITEIIADPHYRGSGVHVTSPGGMLRVHSDFNTYAAYKLRRRVNSFIFLNDRWPDKYGGHLELWNRNMSSCRQRIAPSWGRFVAFSSNDFSYHGHPEPLTAPDGRFRRSLALYYYTQGAPKEDCIGGDCDTWSGTKWQSPKCGKSCLDPACNGLPGSGRVDAVKDVLSHLYTKPLGGAPDSRKSPSDVAALKTKRIIHNPRPQEKPWKKRSEGSRKKKDNLLRGC